MNVFEKMVLEEQDSDNKFVDAASFFVSMKTPMAKTAQKGVTKVKMTKLPKTLEEGATDVRRSAREMSKSITDSAGGKPVALKPRKGSNRILKTDDPSIKEVKGAQLAEIKSLKKKKLVSKVKESNIKNLPYLLKAHLAAGANTVKNPGSSGYLAGMAAPQKTPGFFSQLYESAKGKVVNTRLGKAIADRRLLSKINESRKSRGLKPFKLDELDEARKWNKGFQRTQGIGEFVGQAKSYIADPTTGKITPSSLAAGASSLGLTPEAAYSAGMKAQAGAGELMRKRQSILDRNMMLPAIGAAGVAGLGAYGYGKYRNRGSNDPGQD